MRKPVLVLIAVAVSAASAVAFPVPKRPAESVPKLEGTVWEGPCDDTPTTWRFLAGGGLSYSYNGNTYVNGSWKQDGKKVYWECNGGYAEYDGTVENDEIKARAKNVTGKEWEAKAKRVKDAAAAR